MLKNKSIYKEKKNHNVKETEKNSQFKHKSLRKISNF
jgi:hypothetical protein